MHRALKHLRTRHPSTDEPMHSSTLLRQVLRFVGEPGLVVGSALDVDETAHAVMAEAAQLRTGDLVLADAVRDEPDGDVESRDSVLFHAHLVQPEAVDDVLAR